MNSQFQALPQIEFPDNVKNTYYLKVIAELSIHLCFIFISSIVYSLVPFVFFFNPFLIFTFGFFCLGVSRYSPQCSPYLIGIYLFCIGYFLAYVIPYVYLEYAIVSILTSYLVSSAYLLGVSPESNKSLFVIAVFCNVFSIFFGRSENFRHRMSLCELRVV